MLKVKLSEKASAHMSHLSDLRFACEDAYGIAVGEGKSAQDVSFAGTGMRLTGRNGLPGRGKIARDLLAGAGTYRFDGSAADFRFIENAFAFRCDLVGYLVSRNDAGDVVVRKASREEKEACIRNAARITERSFAQVAAISGFAKTVAPVARKAKASASEGEAA